MECSWHYRMIWMHAPIKAIIPGGALSVPISDATYSICKQDYPRPGWKSMHTGAQGGPLDMPWRRPSWGNGAFYGLWRGQDLYLWGMSRVEGAQTQTTWFHLMCFTFNKNSRRMWLATTAIWTHLHKRIWIYLFEETLLMLWLLMLNLWWSRSPTHPLLFDQLAHS